MTEKLWGEEEGEKEEEEGEEEEEGQGRHDGKAEEVCNHEDHCAEEEMDEEDCFFESLDRVPSGISIDADFPSSGSDEDDLRISFASAIAPPSGFRQVSFSDDIDDEGKGYDYGLWMAEPISIKERRRRLLQGMGLASGKGLSFCSSSCSGGGGDGNFTMAPERAMSRRILPADNDPQAVAEAGSRVIARCKSDTKVAALAAQPALSRSSSAPPFLLDLHGSPISRPRSGLEGGQFGDGSSGGTADGGSDFVIIKNLDTGKEFVVSELGKDETWGRLNDLQTGLQLTLDEFEKFLGYSPIVKELMRRANLGGDRRNNASTHKSSKRSGRKKGNWLKNIKLVASSVTGLISDKERGDPGGATSGTNSSNSSERLKVHQHGKSYKELTGLYMCQEIHAHQGSIWSIKFSSDSRYLASAGEDRIVHVWQVLEGNAFSSSLRQQKGCSALLGAQTSKTTRRGKSSKKSIPDYIVMPETIFSLSEKPVCSFEGHLDDVLDLSWSKSQYLLSSSMDKTVRLWDMESKTCLKLFAHNDYVTSIQFNPVDDRYFISGSLDAKVRIWSIPERLVVDWSDLHEMVTATCYTPDGQGALVGSHKGSCRFYKTSDCKLYLEAQIDIRNKKRKSRAKKITGFQVSEILAAKYWHHIPQMGSMSSVQVKILMSISGNVKLIVASMPEGKARIGLPPDRTSTSIVKMFLLQFLGLVVEVTMHHLLYRPGLEAGMITI
ncbi:uncharacterized protein [Typha latifolia]|uniref:uncharacterized protein isoform X2 n=1 Tax=Typha latifolia TaxID=4733 RepID=UPI003C2EC382